MGGSGSGNDNPVYTDSNFNPDTIKAFAGSTAGSKYSRDQINQLYTSREVKQGPNSLGSMDASNNMIDEAFLNAFNAYRNDQTNSTNAWKNYVDLTTKQAGGEGQQTILGSASTNPYQTILAAHSAMGNPATQMTIRQNQKKVGAP